MQKLATIGYEGSTPKSFDAALAAAHVHTVVDIRALALEVVALASRKQS